MTSSLVGSEMCIRDRHLTMHRSVGQLPGWSSISNQHNTWDSATFHVPVSYTHLTLPTICSV
eukprot:12517634-Prorocentrum_lima.AAC.1